MVSLGILEISPVQIFSARTNSFFPSPSSPTFDPLILILLHNGTFHIPKTITTPQHSFPPTRRPTGTLQAQLSLPSTRARDTRNPAQRAPVHKTNPLPVSGYTNHSSSSLSSATSSPSPPSWTASWSSASSPRPRLPPVSSSPRLPSRSRTRPRSSPLAPVSSTRRASVSPWVSLPVTRFSSPRYVTSAD